MSLMTQSTQERKWDPSHHGKAGESTHGSILRDKRHPHLARKRFFYE
jgi:hypothetical protein